MSSYIMHLCISDMIKKKLKLTDKFMYGSVLPDVLKSITGDRNGTHYIETVIVDGEERKLPNIQKAINELDMQDKEIRLGYIAHLVEDLIWFNNYIPTYAKKMANNNMQYLVDKSVHSANEFRQDIYSDYINSGEYIVKKCNSNLPKVVSNLLDMADNKDEIKLILNSTKIPKESNISNNIFMTKESIDSYIEECTKEVEKVVLELMGE